MSGLPPTYTEALAISNSGALVENLATEVLESVPYPPGTEQQFVSYLPHPNALQPGAYDVQSQEQIQQPYPLTQPHPPIQPPYIPIQQPYLPAQQYPVYYPQGYIPQQPPGLQNYPPSQPVDPQPQIADVTAAVEQSARFSGGASSFKGIIAFSAITMICFFPFGIVALIVAVYAYKRFVRDSKESKRALALARIATGLGISSVILGIFTTIGGFIWGVIISVVT